MTFPTPNEIVFTLDCGNGVPYVALYRRTSGDLTLYRDGLVAMRDAMYDLEYYAKTRRYWGAPVEEVAKRVSCWGRVTGQRGITMSSLSHAQYLALMRGEDVAVESATAPAVGPVAPQPAAELPGDRAATVAWKQDVPRSREHAPVAYFEARACGQTTYRVGGSTGRWFVLRSIDGSGVTYRTPFVRSHERAVALLDSLTP